MRKEFSIIIVTYNGLHDLRKCLDSLRSQLPSNWEILVVDNASSDGTNEFVAAMSDDSLRYLPLATNTGFAVANNAGAAQARGEWLFLLNNDTTCASRTLSAIAEGTKSSLQFRIFACRMIRSADGRVDNLGIQFTRQLRGTQIGSGAAHAWADSREVFGASGGAMVVHRSVIDDIGLFDPIFFAYQEDVDFAVRARLAGYRCLYLPDAIVHHKGNATSASNPSFYRYFNQRNMELVLRNLPGRIWWKYALRHLAYAAYQILKWTLKGDGINVLRAKIDGLALARKSPPCPTPIRIRPEQFEEQLAGEFPLPPPRLTGVLKPAPQD